ncbi:hypothetical protein CapIbe_004448 [Capra ibex]
MTPTTPLPPHIPAAARPPPGGPHRPCRAWSLAPSPRTLFSCRAPRDPAARRAAPAPNPLPARLEPHRSPVRAQRPIRPVSPLVRGRIGASGPGHGTGPGVSSSASRTASSHSCHLRAPPARRPTEPEPQPGPDGSDVTMGQPTPGRACGAPPTGGRGAHAGRLSGLAAAGLGVLWNLGSGGFVSNLDLGSVAPRRLSVRRRFISGFPARGRPRLVGGSSAGAGAASRGPSHHGLSAPATARTALPPALRTAAALRVSAPDPPPPHPARLCRLFLSPSLPSGRRCRCRRRRRHRARFRPRPASAVQGPSVQAPGPRLPASPGPGPGTMSEKSVEAAAELSAKDLKEKKEKVEEKAGRKERKKEVVEEEENGAEEEEEETAEDGEEEDEGDEEDEEEEEDEDEGPALKRAAEEEDEADPKRQKTENGASA